MNGSVRFGCLPLLEAFGAVVRSDFVFDVAARDRADSWPDGELSRLTSRPVEYRGLVAPKTVPDLALTSHVAANHPESSSGDLANCTVARAAHLFCS